MKTILNKQRAKILRKGHYIISTSALLIFFLSINLVLPNKPEIAGSNSAYALKADSTISICSFNIQFLGQSSSRDNEALATILKDFEIVVVQELLAPPYKGKYPDGTDYNPDPQAKEFFDKMSEEGFGYNLSLEDTGPGDENHKNSTSTEWWVVFYKPDKVQIAADLPTQFLEQNLTNNSHFDRVPYAFGFRTLDGKMDFDLISVHLKPDDNHNESNRRKEELASIKQWINAHDNAEKDFIILGDMNINDSDELKDDTPSGFKSLNDECRATNTNVYKPRPYDHVMYRTHYTTEIDKRFDFRVFNLIEAMRPFWNSNEPYPGGAINPIEQPEYNHDEFRKYYSDHNPIVFRMIIPESDDD